MILSPIKCKSCGSLTNTAISDCIDTWPNAKECYARVDPKSRIWVEGCGYKKANKYDKYLADRVIGKPAVISIPIPVKKDVDSKEDITF